MSRKLIALLVVALAAGAVALGVQEGSDEPPNAPEPTAGVDSGAQSPLTLVNAHDRVIEGGEYTSVSIEKSRNITIRGASGSGVWDAKQSEEITFDGIDLDGGAFRVRGSDSVTIENSRVHDGILYGEGAFCGNCGVGAFTYADVPTTNLTIRDNTFERLHGDGTILSSVTGATVEGNRYEDSTPEETGDHVDTIQLLFARDITILDNRSTGFQHGVEVTNGTPVDGPDADDRAVVAVGNYFRPLTNWAWNGPPGVNSLIAHNVFGCEAEPCGANFPTTIKGDETTSGGAEILHNVIDGILNVGDGISEDWNVTRVRSESAVGPHDRLGGFGR